MRARGKREYSVVNAWGFKPPDTKIREEGKRRKEAWGFSCLSSETVWGYGSPRMVFNFLQGRWVEADGCAGK